MAKANLPMASTSANVVLPIFFPKEMTSSSFLEITTTTSRDMWVSHSDRWRPQLTEATDVDDTDWVISACPISGPKWRPWRATR
ncbi:MAG: hypothetical protein R2825_02055 [Saprospiraceae bacterium]